jgi:DNA (cytosine-5)-methyltransferase 1
MSLRGIDLFCGAGGGSWGAAAAGVRMVGAVDQWGIATATYADNFPSARGNVVTATLSTETGPELFQNIGRIDLLIASPECTHHSVARGRRPRCSESQGSSSYVLRFVEGLSPQHIVIENVEAMIRWEGYTELFRILGQRHGYKLTAQVLDAADFGVPQSRKRLFIFGSRRRRPNQIKTRARKHRPVRRILDRKGTWPAGPLENGRRARNTIDRVLYGIEQVGWGNDFLTVYYGSDGAGGYQTLDRPLRTLTTLDRFGLVQWDDRLPTLRMLQVPELKRAMGLPDGAQLRHGSRRDRIRLLGNGVCPPVMQAVVEELVEGRSSARPRLLEAAE